MRYRFRSMTALVAVAAVGLAACGGDDDASDDTSEEAEPATEATDAAEPADEPATEDGADISVALVLNGELGDEAFFDSANRGAEQAATELGIEVRVIEAGLDAAGWEPALRSAVASGDYDLVITGTAPMADVLGPLAEEFPDQQFVFYDAALAADNIHSITYAQNEASYLGGVVAGGLTSSGIEGTNDDLVVGFVGGLDLPVINDFRAGYAQGAASVVPDVEVLTSYAAGFGDPAQGRELAEAQIDQGADVIFQVAGGTGFGVFEASTGRGTYAVGVDTNQNPLAPGTIATSVQKNVDVSLFQAIERFAAGDLPFGVTETLGLAEGGVSLAMDEYYEQIVPEDVRTLVDEARDAIIAGEIEVDTTLGS
ncbi:MAG: BMP family ABC transporter substrate-binding protein [Ilumatobacter fluminis]|uniref:BMP family lipoprotein n=1 Tax=Ilumatobacter fluminis TaxID=467091 RepID=UPI0032EEB01F